MPSPITVKPADALRGEITVPGDKSISHRAVMFGAMAEGLTRISGFLSGADCLATVDCFRRLGVSVDMDERSGSVLVHGLGMRGFAPDRDPVRLYTGNSGTTTRIISGILAPQPFISELSGDDSVNSRPMKRIIEPLTQMGSRIESLKGNGCAPLRITGSALHGITYRSPVASAQVKSAILCAGLYAEGATCVIEPALSRDHTERMLSAFGADVTSELTAEGWAAGIRPCSRLDGQDIHVPGDISSAAYFLTAGAIVPGSEILLRGVGCNPTRAGILTALGDMGAEITPVSFGNGPEPEADLLVRTASLHGTVIGGNMIPTLIDELPVLAVAAAYAAGTTVIRDAAELKVKETNRIDTVTENLRAMGADVTPTEDGMVIRGGKPLHGARIRTYGDHRIAMAFAVAALAAEGETVIDNRACVDVSYPGFFDELTRITE